jgi:hypothetical protein
MMRGSVLVILVILVIFGHGRVVRFPFLRLETEHLSVHLGDLILRALRGGL